MKLFYAFEIATNSSFHIHVDQDQYKLKEILEQLEQQLNQWLDGPTIMGYVYANDVESAIDKVRLGKWAYKWNLIKDNLSESEPPA